MKQSRYPRTLRLDSLSVGVDWIPEPKLRFADGIEHDDPKVGIALAGPRSLRDARHRADIHVGFIGTAGTIDDAARWLERCAAGIDGEPVTVEDNATAKASAPFPGCDLGTGYRFKLLVDVNDVGKITYSDLTGVNEQRTSRARFEHFLELLDRKLGLLHDLDRPLDCVFVVLPDDLYAEFRSADYRHRGTVVHRDLRRAFKALAMRHDLPTQILRHSTIRRPARGRNLDHPATVAWNLFNGLYFKAGGAPWAPVGLQPATCALGVSFYRPLGDDVNLRTSVVQAFDEHGDVFVLRGLSFPWDDRSQGKQPHLARDLARQLVEHALARYRQERGQLPRRVIVHKRSRFSVDESDGFLEALAGIQVDLVALRPASDYRLLREGQYPVLRGTHYQIGDNSYLYTTGYLHRLRSFPHGHVPTPLEVADHIGGDTPRRTVLEEILLLTKMNWNSAEYAEALPITLRFATLVGEIMREVPAGIAPRPKYAFYM